MVVENVCAKTVHENVCAKTVHAFVFAVQFGLL
jgi:hypothetical protein